jgi:hypothetical protein
MQLFKNNFGKLMVYASDEETQYKTLESIRMATKKTAHLLNMNFEFIKFKKTYSKIYVYYDNGTDEPIPLYCDKGKKEKLQDICTTLRKMMFVLSFHPKHSGLKRVRDSIMTFS